MRRKYFALGAIVGCIGTVAGAFWGACWCLAEYDKIDEQMSRDLA